MKHSPTHTHSMRQGEVILGPPLVNIASELAGDRLVGGGGVGRRWLPQFVWGTSL